MKKFTLLFFFLSAGFSAYCTTWTVTTPGFNFSPPTLTIASGDTVVFDIGFEHNAVEVSMTTWNSNGATPLAGGFSVPLGGGEVSGLSVGTHFYVCQPHSSMGMKGMIIVEQSTAVDEGSAPSAFSIYPNPSGGKIYLTGNSVDISDFQVEIFDTQGVRILERSRIGSQEISTLDIPVLDHGIYFVRLRDDKRIYTRKVIIQ